MVAAWASCGEEYWIRSSLVTPSMRRAHLRPELCLHLMEGQVGVLHRVVEKGGGEGRGIESVVGQDLGDRHRVGDVGVAGLANLALMGRSGGGEGMPLDPAREVPDVRKMPPMGIDDRGQDRLDRVGVSRI